MNLGKPIAAALALATLAAVPADVFAGGKHKYARERQATRDCTPYNGPFGYYGNPWCDGGYKFAEDYPPGASPHHDVFDLPQVRRLERRLRRD
ncbi:hypothetical protein [Hyphomicrobium sp. CS1GBMeth3]|uniref:hypothetical protein n=1 Tax=Hyphomicrobium sp. CS1GBMeth3 TaxID=1892845 RepID=UPI0009305E66|nr:hypothetical protein [Hyphomicrobium sp. CS1GBMeth3]